MEKANIAQGLIILPNGIGAEMGIDENGHRVVGPARAFRPHPKIQEALGNNLVQDQGRCKLNSNQVEIEGTQTKSKIAENTQQIHAEKVQSK